MCVNIDPNAPQNVVANDITTTSITLQWDVQCHGEYSYQVEYGRVGSTTKELINVNRQNFKVK